MSVSGGLLDEAPAEGESRLTFSCRWRQCEVHWVFGAASGGPSPVVAALCMDAGVLAWEGRRGLHTLPAAMACHLPRCQLGHVALCKVLWGAEAEARYLGMA